MGDYPPSIRSSSPCYARWLQIPNWRFNSQHKVSEGQAPLSRVGTSHIAIATPNGCVCVHLIIDTSRMCPCRGCNSPVNSEDYIRLMQRPHQGPATLMSISEAVQCAIFEHFRAVRASLDVDVVNVIENYLVDLDHYKPPNGI